MARGIHHLTDYRTTAKGAGNHRGVVHERVVAVDPSRIDEVLGTRTARQRTALLRRFRDDGRLICSRGLRARVRVGGPTRWGRRPRALMYVFALPEIDYVLHAADRYRRRA